MPSATQNDHPTVLIVGGGIAGLVLAQALRKQNIPFELFERDANAAARFQGWAISLHWIMNDLLAALPDDLPSIMETSHLSNLGLEADAYQYNGETGEVLFHLGGMVKLLRANRQKLRNLLMTNLDIQWGKKLSYFEETKSGVTVYFTDGSSATGDILVGADGAHSSVRTHLFKDNPRELQPIPVGIVNGTPTLTKEHYEHLIALGHSYHACFAPTGRSVIFNALASVADDKESASYYWMFAWPDPKAAKEPYWTTKASQQQLYEYVLERTKMYLPQFTETVRETKVEEVRPFVLHDIVPEAMPRTRVTLVGDAAHTMSPFRGEGGNHAMRDALDLAKVLPNSKGRILDALKEYEVVMIPRASDAVLKSRQATQETDGQTSRDTWKESQARNAEALSVGST